MLMVGAGGIGCELLKTLALSGFRDIHIVSRNFFSFFHYLKLFLGYFPVFWWLWNFRVFFLTRVLGKACSAELIETLRVNFGVFF